MGSFNVSSPRVSGPGNPSDDSPRAIDDPRVIQRIHQYRAALEAGESPDYGRLVAEHPEIAEELTACLDALAFVHQVVPQLRCQASGQLQDEPKHPDVPSVGALGDFRILREIGRGGMGVVYEAEQVSLSRRVALKVLPFAAVLDPRHLQRFKNEAHAAAQLHHTNIVPVHAVGCERGVHYYAMQYIEGQTLARVIGDLRRLERPKAGAVREADRAGSSPAGTPASDRLEPAQSGPGPEGATSTYADRETPAGPSPSDTGRGPQAAISTERSTRSPKFCRSVAQLGVQVAEALDYAHDEGVVHRDIKPSNLILDEKGKVWVTDFGLARLESEPGLTMTGDVLGTLRYMSPEQALARRIAVDHRTDVYSLGVTLYELLTLQPAFPGENREEVLRRIAFEEPKPPRRLNKAVPTELQTIVLKAMAKTPAERYATAGNLAEDLRRFLEDLPIHARRPTLLQRAAKWSRRHRAIVTTAAIAAVLLLIAVAVGAILVAAKERDARIEETALRDRAEDAERQAKARLFEAYLAQARASRWSHRPGRRFEGMEVIADAVELVPFLNPAPEEILRLRNEAIACMSLRGDLRVIHRRSFSSESWWADFDPTLEHYARPEKEQEAITIRRIDDDVEVMRLPSSGAAYLRFSPDGRLLATAHAPDACRLWQWSEQRLVLERPMIWNHRMFDFSPRGRTLAVVGPDSAVHFHDTTSGEAVRSIPLPSEPDFVRFHPHGQQLTVVFGAEVQLWDIQSGRIAWRLGESAPVIRLAWRGDGKRLVTACSDNTAHTWNAETGQRLTTLEGGLREASFHPDGSTLAARQPGGMTFLWDPLLGQSLIGAPGRPVRFSQDGRRLAFNTSYGVGVWDVATGEGYVPLFDPRVQNAAPGQIDFSPDGRLMVSSWWGVVRLWDMATCQPIAELPSGWYCALFDSAGRTLVTNGATGLLQWPLVFDGRSGRLRIGPPETLHDHSHEGFTYCDFSPGRRFLGAVVGPKQVLVVDTEERQQKVLLDGHAGVQGVAISPDGRWAVTCPKHGSGLWLWNARTGEHVEDLWPGEGWAMAAFSPDGQWLVACKSQEYRRWRVGHWKQDAWELPRDGGSDAPGAIVFSPDGQLMVVQPSARVLRLLQPATGDELASLQSHDEWYGYVGRFSPEGTRLAVSGPNRVHLWDLRQVREQLAELDLDWDAPPYPPTPPAAAKPLDVQIQLTQPHTPSGKLFCVDLTLKANRELGGNIHRGGPGMTCLAALPRGEHTFSGVKFSIGEKLLHLGAAHLPQNVLAVEGIEVNRPCAKLHVLHAVAWGNGVKDGIAVGQYKLRYEDGTDAVISIRCGQDLRDWVSDEHVRPLSRGKLAWLAKDGRNGLYLTSWENPHPEKNVVGIDYISTEEGQAAPFCVAITVEGPALTTNNEP